MRAVMLEGPKRLETRDVDKPASTGDIVVMRVTACGICGSDIHYWELGVGMDGKPGLIMGHEFCGVVEDPGPRADLAAGDRVAVIPLDPCDQCPACKSGAVNLCPYSIKRNVPGNNAPGGYAEYTAARPDMVRKLPGGMSDLAAIMIEPAAVGLHAVRRAGVGVGDTVLVTGGGTIGLLCAAWARLAGASLVALTEVHPHRLAYARDRGVAHAVFDASGKATKKELKMASGGGFDKVIETSATDPGLKAALGSVRLQGTVVLAGINFAPQPMSTLMLTTREITQKGSMAYLPGEFDLAADYIAGGRLDVDGMVSLTVGLEDVPVTFEKLADGSLSGVKVAVAP
ncbi:MAG: zinc-dependent alcohol dehydrogenase [Desulfatibacillaceae bacterium]